MEQCFLRQFYSFVKQIPLEEQLVNLPKEMLI